MASSRVLVVMGVSGSGKSTVAQALAQTLGCPFADGDDFHAPEAVARMHGGHPLDDAERAPWLARVAAWIDARLAAGEQGVIACSALRRSYRDRLVQGRHDVRIVYLEGDRALIGARLAQRRGHFMPSELLDSQFDALEPPGPDERPIIVGIENEPAAIVSAILAQLSDPGQP